jgi:hypothetical protein
MERSWVLFYYIVFDYYLLALLFYNIHSSPTVGNCPLVPTGNWDVVSSSSDTVPIRFVIAVIELYNIWFAILYTVLFYFFLKFSPPAFVANSSLVPIGIDTLVTPPPSEPIRYVSLSIISLSFIHYI